MNKADDHGTTQMDRQNRQIILLVCLLLFLRIVAATILEFGIDEVYYWYYSLHLKWSYFDHPPMLAWNIYLTTFGGSLSEEFFVRLPAILSWTISCILIFHALRTNYGFSRATIFLALFSLSIYTSIVAGTLIIPDAPLLLWTGVLIWSLIQWDRDGRDGHLMIIFLATGLCNWSKYQSLIFAPILIFWFWRYYREVFRKRSFYFGLALYVAITIPLVLFNFLGSDDQLSYHGSRFSISHFDGLNLFKTIFTEVIFQHPVVFLAIVIAVLKTHNMSPIQKLWIWLALPIIALGWCLSFFETILPHWTGPAYIFLIVFCAMSLEWKKHISVFKGALIIQCILVVLAVVEIKQGWFSNQVASSKNIYYQGRADGTLDMYGWHQLRTKLKNRFEIDTLAINHWYPGAHLHHYIARPLAIELLPIGDSGSLHEYIYHRNANQSIPEGSYFIESSRFPRRHMGDLLIEYEFEEVGRIPITRRNDTVMTYFVNRLWRCPE